MKSLQLVCTKIFARVPSSLAAGPTTGAPGFHAAVHVL
jgi:hypothetical protein